MVAKLTDVAELAEMCIRDRSIPESFKPIVLVGISMA